MSGVDLRVNSTKSILKENIEEFEKRNQVLSSLVDNLCVKANDLHEKYFKKKKKKKQTKKQREEMDVLEKIHED